MTRTFLIAAATLAALAGGASAMTATNPAIVEAQIAAPGADFSNLTDRQVLDLQIAVSSSDSASDLRSAITSILAN